MEDLLAILLLLNMITLRATAQMTETDTIRANLLMEQAQVQSHQGNYLQAADLYAEASTIYADAGQPMLEINAIHSQADNQRRAGNFALAEMLALRNLGNCQRHHQSPHRQTGRAHHLLGIVQDYQTKYDQAISSNLKALEIYSQCPGDLRMAQADVYNSLGVNYYHKSHIQKALDNYFHCLDLYNQVLEPGHQRIADTYLNIGVVYFRNGRNELALQYYEMEMAMTSVNLGPEHPFVSHTANNMGSIYSKLGNFEKSRQYLDKALAISDKRYGEFSIQSAQIHSNLGHLQRDQEAYQKAFPHYRKALKIIGQTIGDRSPMSARLYLSMSDCYLGLGEFQAAEDRSREALDIYLKDYGSKSPYVAQSYLSLSDVAASQGLLQEALEYCQQALMAVVPQFNTMGVQSNPGPAAPSLDPNIYLIVLEQKSTLWLQQYQKEPQLNYLESALHTLRLSNKLVDHIQRDQLLFQDKLHLARRTNGIYEKAVETCFELFQQTNNIANLVEAWQYSHKSKATLLRHFIAEDQANTFGEVSSELLELENGLKVDRNFLENKIQQEKVKSKSGNDSLTQELTTYLFNLNRRHDSLILAIERQYPKYYKLKYDREPVTVENLQLQVKNDAFIEYFMADSMLFTFVINENGIVGKRTPIGNAFQDLIADFRSQITQRTSDPVLLNATAAELYHILMGPIKPLLKTGQSLKIIPHGALSLIPFELLVSSETAPESDTYLFQDHPISYQFSTDNSLDQEKTERKWKQQFAGFAPTYTADLLSSAPELDNFPDLRENLSPLPFADSEIREASTFFKSGHMFVAAEANEAGFKADCGNYQILHLAMHALIDQENPMLSKLIFSQDSTLSSEDGYLTASEIFNLELNADLAVLSACNTALGKIAEGEGVMSLGRAFAYAGCPSIVMSLWPAQDQATAKLMALFYEGIADGLSKDQALRTAKIKYLENTNDLFAHPFYWAGFVVHGDASPISIKKGLQWWHIAIPLVLMVLLVIYRYHGRYFKIYR